MTTNADNSSGLTIYPAYCHKASPTFFAWAKLTAYDVHSVLTKKWGFEVQKIYFYKNHPIKFVRLAGVVVSFFESERRWIFVLDDSSGATIEVVGIRPQEPKDEATLPNPGGNERITDNGADLSGIDVGSVVKVKGLIGEWWGTRQLLLERVSLLRDTNEEVMVWEENTRFLVDVLSKPWFLSLEEQKRLLAEAEDDKGKDRRIEEKRRDRERRRRKREERHQVEIRKEWEKEENQREKEGEACREECKELFGTFTAEAFRKRRRVEKPKTANSSSEQLAGGVEKFPKKRNSLKSSLVTHRTTSEAL